MKLHPDTQRCSDLFDKLAGILKAEEDQTISASALSLLMFDYVMHQEDAEDTARALIAVLECMLVSFDHGVGPMPKTTH
jgi:hypothetical protein